MLSGDRDRGAVALGGGLAVVALTFGAVLGPAQAAWAKGSAVLQARETQVQQGQPIHFFGEIGDDGGLKGAQACLFEVVGGHRFEPLRRCAPLTPSPGEPPSHPSQGGFVMSATAGAAGPHAYVVAVEWNGKVELEPGGEPIGHSSPIQLMVTAAKPSGGSSTAAQPNAAGQDAKAQNGPTWRWLAVGAVPVAALVVIALRRRRQR